MKKIYLGILLLSLLWGVPYFFIALALPELHPFWIAFIRTLIAALVLLPYTVWKREHPPWKPVLAVACIEMIIPISLLPWGQQQVTSSLAGLLIAMTPLWMAVMTPFIGKETMTYRTYGGFVFGIIGVMLAIGVDFSGKALGIAAVLLASVCYALGSFPLAHYRGNIISFVCYAQALSAVILSCTLPWLPAPVWSGEAIIASLVLGIVPSALGLSVWAWVARQAGATRASLATYIAPLWAISIGVVFADDPLHWTLIAGALMVLAGSLLVGIEDVEAIEA